MFYKDMHRGPNIIVYINKHNHYLKLTKQKLCSTHSFKGFAWKCQNNFYLVKLLRPDIIKK